MSAFGHSRGATVSLGALGIVAALAARPAVHSRIAHDLQAESCVARLVLLAVNPLCSLYIQQRELKSRVEQKATCFVRIRKQSGLMMYYVKCLVFIAIVMTQSSARAEELPNVDAVLAANQLMIEKVKQLDLTCLVRKVGADPHDEPLARVRWAFDLTKQFERIREGKILLLNDGDSPPIDFPFTDSLIDGNKYKCIRNWDLDWNAEIPEGVTNAVGFEGLLDDGFPGIYDPRALLLWKVSSPAISYEEANNQGKAIVKGYKNSSSGHKCLQLDIPADPNVEPISFSFSVFFDPTCSYAVREVSAKSLPVKIQGRELVISSRSTVEKFESYGQGIYLPVSVITVRSDSNFNTRAEFDYKSVNDDIDKRAFEMVFPANLRLNEIGSNRIMIADGNGGYLKEWDDPREMIDWYSQEFQISNGEKVSKFSSIRISIILFLIAIGVLVFWFKRSS